MVSEEASHRPSSRLPEPFREHLSKRLAGDAAVGGAAGVGPMVAAPPARADIIYTPADVKLKSGSSLYLDLDHNVTNDFLFIDQPGLGLGSTTFLIPKGLRAGNEILESGSFKSALALPFGAEIGLSGRFSRSGTTAFAYHALIGGARGHAENRCLGLEFVLNRETHFGWAEFSVGQEEHGRDAPRYSGGA